MTSINIFYYIYYHVNLSYYYLSCRNMSSVGLSGLSNISNDTLQGRYQKALKQINKLIEINRELKQRVGEYEKDISKYQQQLHSLQQANHHLDQQNSMIDSKYMELNHMYEQLQMYCRKLEEQIQHNEMNNNHIGEKMRENEMKYQEQIQHQIQKYNTLARQSQFIQHGYQQSLTTIQMKQSQKQQLERQIQDLQRQNAQLKDENNKLNELIEQKNIIKLQNELQQSYKSIENLIKQCNILKSQQIDIEVYEQKQRVQKQIGLGISLKDVKGGDAIKQLINQYKRKIKQLQQQKKNIYQKYKNTKNKLQKLASNQNLYRKIQGLERLTQKQQRQMGRIIDAYDRELNNIHHANVKIKQAYISISKTLSKKGRQLGEKQKAISQLKMTTDRINYQNQSLKKVNSTLIQQKQSRLRQYSQRNNGMNHTQSITISHLRSSSQPNQQSTPKMKVSQVQKGINVGNIYQKDESFIRTQFQTVDQQKIPITVSYGNGQKGDFKFIQSVNIINGYNVSLSENTAKSNK